MLTQTHLNTGKFKVYQKCYYTSCTENYRNPMPMCTLISQVEVVDGTEESNISSFC